MDMDAFVAAHEPTWQRLDWLVRHRRRLDGPEVDELVELYQQTLTHLSTVRSASTDALLVGRLSGLTARARSAVTGANAPARRELVRFFVVSFPAAAYHARRWWLGAALASIVVGYVVGVWVATNPEVQAAIGTPDEIKQLVERDFADYYSQAPAASFAGQVWVNNAWVSAQVIVSAILLGLPIPYILFQNAANAGVIGGLMAANGKAEVFWGLLIPHGLLEL
ncbi:MAG: stage II sporulation protein M, partial [Propionibacteriales bacterium]|nr:stage II sporulation protein M [Propionibacteriales bacterium]